MVSVSALNLLINTCRGGWYYNPNRQKHSSKSKYKCRSITFISLLRHYKPYCIALCHPLTTEICAE